MLIAALLLTSCAAGQTRTGTFEASVSEMQAPAKLRCGSWTIDGRSFGEPATAETEDAAPAAALRGFIADAGGAEPVPSSGWRYGYRGEALVVYMHGGPPRPLAVGFAREDAGWTWAGMTRCELRTTRDGTSSANWALDPTFPRPEPSSTLIHLLVDETACTGGRRAHGRIQDPDIAYRDDAVVISTFVTPLPTGAYTCQGVGPTPTEIRLREPLGDRELLDGGTWPPRIPRSPVGGLI